MVSRGSSVHHTRRTSNPFMATSSGIVGINLNEPAAFDVPRLAPDNQQSLTHSHEQATTTLPTGATLKDFMYKTTSQALGEGVRVSERSRLSQRMDKIALQKEIASKGLVKVNTVDTALPSDYALSPEDVLPPPVDVSSIAGAREEHPLYATSTREIGVEKPQLKVDIDRVSRPNTFTNSFNGFRYRDYGLNTAITKSRICEQLDT